MHLHLLHDTPPVSIFYDTTNDWLFAEWHGDLSLEQVQAGCLTLAQPFVKRPYVRVLNSNQHVTSMAEKVPVWLARELLPHMGTAGIEYLAWVYAPHLPVRHLVDEAVRQVETPVVQLFDDLAEAYAWLQHARPYRLDASTLGPRPPERQAELTRLVGELSHELADHRQHRLENPMPH